MFKILLNKPNLPKGSWVFHTKTVLVSDPDEPEAPQTKETKIFEVGTAEELKDEYLSLLKTYTADQIKAIEDLDTDLEVTITNT